MEMIRHQTVDRAEQFFSGSGVEHQFAKSGVEWFIQPTLRSILQGQRPENNRVTAIVLARQTRQFSFGNEMHKPTLNAPMGECNATGHIFL